MVYILKEQKFCIKGEIFRYANTGLLNMKTMTEKKFDTVKFFRSIKEKHAAKMANMTFEEQREFLK
jgi:hypothetical protein